MGLNQVLLGPFILTKFFTTASALASPRHFPHTQSSKLPCSLKRTNWTYNIPRTIQNGTSTANLHIHTPNKLHTESALLSLEKPQISKVTSTSFDWWYFDAISSTNPHESLTVTLFSASATAFPWLDSTEDSVLIAYLWATFANGSSFADYVPATLASVSGEEAAAAATAAASAGQWKGTGFSWNAIGDNFENYEVIVQSQEMGVYGTFRLESVSFMLRRKEEP